MHPIEQEIHKRIYRRIYRRFLILSISDILYHEIDPHGLSILLLLVGNLKCKLKRPVCLGTKSLCTYISVWQKQSDNDYKWIKLNMQPIGHIWIILYNYSIWLLYLESITWKYFVCFASMFLSNYTNAWSLF
jgi:hypothetical protein